MNAVKTRFWRLVTSRAAIIVLNLAFAIFSARALLSIVLDLWAGCRHGDQMERIAEGLAVLGIAYGVALGSRKDLMEMLDLYPSLLTRRQERIDQVCHDFGLLLVLFGLFIEIPIQAVKVPDHLFNTAHIEVEVLGLAGLFSFLATVASLLANLRLLKLPALRHPQESAAPAEAGPEA